MVSSSANPYGQAFLRVTGHDEQLVLEDTGRSYLDNLPWTAAEPVVSLSRAFAKYFVRCILRTRIHHEYNYYLEWRQFSKRQLPELNQADRGGEC